MRLSAWNRRRIAHAEILPPGDTRFAEDLRRTRATPDGDVAARIAELRRLRAGNTRLLAAIMGGISLILIPPLLILLALLAAILLWALGDLGRILLG